MKTAEERGIQVPAPQGFRGIPGRGFVAMVNGVEYQMGGPALLQATSEEVPPPSRRRAQAAGERGQSAIYLLRGAEALAVFALADASRPESREASMSFTSVASKWRRSPATPGRSLVRSRRN